MQIWKLVDQVTSLQSRLYKGDAEQENECWAKAREGDARARLQDRQAGGGASSWPVVQDSNKEPNLFGNEACQPSDATEAPNWKQSSGSIGIEPVETILAVQKEGEVNEAAPNAKSSPAVSCLLLICCPNMLASLITK